MEDDSEIPTKDDPKILDEEDSEIIGYIGFHPGQTILRNSR